MQALIDSGKYKVVEVKYSDENYNICLCMDVLKNSNETVIVNTLKSRDYIRAYLPLFVSMKENGPKDFMSLITADGSISVVFRFHDGIRIDDFFTKKRVCEFSDRVDIAENMMLSALELDLADDKIASGVLSEKNIVIDAKELTAGFNYKIDFTADTEENFRGCRLGRFLRIIFPPDRYLPDDIELFIQRLQSGKYPDCVAAYSGWREASADAKEIHEKYLRETFFEYLKRKSKRKLQEKRRASGECEK